MGFGFNLLFGSIIIPVTGILLLIWVITRMKIFGIILAFVWISVVAITLVSIIAQKFNAKILLEKSDFYGSYTIDKTFFKGKQTDWQFDHFRFEIKENDSIYFYVTNKEKIQQTFPGVITTLKPYSSERLVLNMAQPTHHILTSNPTIYRDNHDFYLVFNSPKFHNLFFAKGEWKETDK